MVSHTFRTETGVPALTLVKTEEWLEAEESKLKSFNAINGDPILFSLFWIIVFWDPPAGNEVGTTNEIPNSHIQSMKVLIKFIKYLK